jgi:hypothetical protein
MKGVSIIRTIYLYLFALVGLFILTFSAVTFVGGVMSRYVLPEEYIDYETPAPVGVSPDGKPILSQLTPDQKKAQFATQQNNNLKNKISQSVAGVLIGFPLWWFHWGWIQKDRRREEE